jgi:hypothetical protein
MGDETFVLVEAVAPFVADDLSDPEIRISVNFGY